MKKDYWSDWQSERENAIELLSPHYDAYVDNFIDLYKFIDYINFIDIYK